MRRPRRAVRRALPAQAGIAGADDPAQRAHVGGPAAREPRVEAGRRRAGVRRPPRLRAGRRSALPRLEPVRPARAAGAAAVPGGRGPAGRGAGRRQRLDGGRQPGQARSRAADRRRAGVRRRSRTWIAWRCQPARRRRRRRCCRPARGKGAILPILRFLDGVRASGRVGLAAAVRAFLSRRRRRRRGLAIVISDFYDPAGHRAALDLLRHHRLEVVAIQVSAPQEVAPDAARRRRAARRRDRRGARADGLARGAGRVPPAPPGAAARSRGLLPRARDPLLHGRLRSAVRRRRAAHVPRGRPAALRRPPMNLGVAAVRPVAGARRGRRGRDRRRRDHGAVPGAPAAPRAWSCRSRRCGWTRPVRAARPAGRAACAICCRCCWRWRCSALLLLAAVDPRPAAADRAGRSLVVLIDRSASMSARDGTGDAARRGPRARATAIVDGLAAADRALVASFASDAVAESGFEADAGRLRRAVAAVAPSEEPGDLPRALTFAAAILRGRPAPDGGAGQRRRVHRRGAARRARPTSTSATRRRIGRRAGAAATSASSRSRRGACPPIPARSRRRWSSRTSAARRRRSRSTSRPATPPSSACAWTWRPASAGGTSCPTCSPPTRACRRGC